MGAPQSIPLSEIKAYADIEELTRDELTELLFYVRGLETVYFEHLKKKADQKSGGIRSPNRRAGRRKRR